LIQEAKLVFMVFLYIGVWLDLGLQIYYAMTYYDDDDKLDQELLNKNITAEERADRDAETGEFVRVLCNLENRGEPRICSIACTNRSILHTFTANGATWYNQVSTKTPPSIAYPGHNPHSVLTPNHLTLGPRVRRYRCGTSESLFLAPKSLLE
jgi:hypothetical protein